MEIKYEVLLDKILGCYNGKNAGGVLGAPFECKRGTFPVDYYTQKNIDNNPPPNDDLDLQLLWLNAVEEFGNKISPDILADYWLTYVMPVWSEYGIGKSNLKRGINPPLSGKINNYFGISNGAYIRSEIWACLAPGNPALAARYAYLDACVDHASDGVYGEMFFAALEAAAFVESDKDKLIDIGLSYIPEDCVLRSAIIFAQNCYKTGIEFEDARVQVMTKFPGSFGVCFTKLKDVDKQFPETTIGDDVVNTVGLTVLAWYYGENDFEKTIRLATYCGEDADCTAATAGALLGIILGNEKLPSKWIKPIGNIINTLCISNTIVKANAIPKTTNELTEKILKAIPKFLGANQFSLTPYIAVFGKTGKELYNAPYPKYLKYGSRDCEEYNFTVNELLHLEDNSCFYTFDTFKAIITLEKEPFINEGESIKIKVKVMDNGTLRMPNFVNLSVLATEGLKVQGASAKTLPIHHTYEFIGETEFIILAENLVNEKNSIYFNFSLDGRHDFCSARINLFVK